MVPFAQRMCLMEGSHYPGQRTQTAEFAIINVNAPPMLPIVGIQKDLEYLNLFLMIVLMIFLLLRVTLQVVCKSFKMNSPF